MLQIPPQLQAPFDALLVKKGIPNKYHYDYKKWLRYYLDFCSKYHLPASKQQSLPHFLSKLNEKNQTQEQQKQAQHAISMYYEIVQSYPKKEEIPSAKKDRGFS